MKIKPEALAKLKKSVKFRDEEQVHVFIADAINTYIDLNNFLNKGNKLQVVSPKGKTVNLKLPIQARIEAAAKAKADKN